MYFHVLGGLEVRASDIRINVKAPKQRAVLTTLLLDVNNEVPVDRLTLYVWDGRPPVAVQATLQSYIYRLRRSLSPLDGVQLETGSASYTLQVDPAQTDVWYFRTAVARAHELVQDGDLDGAVRTFRQALSVWRGRALAGISGEYFQQEAQFLEDERIAAHEELFSAELALGAHRKILPELQKAASIHRYHETFRAQLMLALYHSGRQAEALQVYDLIRRQLREDLGIEPGPALQDLHRAILDRVPAPQIMLPSSPV